MGIKRIIDVLTKEGIYTFLYLIKDKIKQNKSEVEKYEAYRKHCEPYLNQQFAGYNKAAAVNMLEVFVLESDTLLEQLQKSNCAYAGFVSEGDALAEHCESHVSGYLQYLQEKGQDCGFLYTDEDEIDERTGVRKNPKFKPEYSPDTVLSYNYIGGFWCAKRELVLEALKQTETTGSLLNEELILCVLSFLKNSQVKHLKGIYYHRRKAVCYNRQEQEPLAHLKERILSEQGVDAVVVNDKDGDIPVQHVLYDCKEQPLVSIIIPSKDNPALLKQCLNSIGKHTKYEKYEIVVVDNGSSEENRARYTQILEGFSRPCLYHYEVMDFNFSKMCNLGAGLANGDYYLFLNDDIEVTDTMQDSYDWITIMLGQAMQVHTGAVGAKLLFPNSTLIQHTGIVNYELEAAHIFSKADDSHVQKDYRNRADYNYLCVTGACLLVDGKKFHQVSGFSEELAVTFNDLELCMKLSDAGYYQVVRNDVVLYHHESVSRGEDVLDEKKFRRHLIERKKLFQMHPQYVKRDSFYSPLLTQKRLDAGINTDYYSVLAKEPGIVDIGKITGSIDMTVQLENVSLKDELVIRGYAYCNEKHNEKLLPYVVLKGSSVSYVIEAKQVYDPTMTVQEDCAYNLNFAQFIAVTDASFMEHGIYDIYIGLKKNKKFKAIKNTGKVIQL